MPTGIYDHLTGSEVSISQDHTYIHQGKAYELSYYTASLAAAATEYLSFTTPQLLGGKVIHFRPTSLSSYANAASITITEGAVMTGGTAATPRNCDRMKPDASLVTVATAATLSTAGIAIIYNDSVGSGGARNRSGGAGGGAENERILKPETTYSIAFKNIGASTATVIYYDIFWYEE